MTRRWSKMPDAIATDAGLSLQARAMYAILLSYDGDRGCFPAKATLARDAGVSPSTVLRLLHELREAGVIVIQDRGKGRTNRYVLVGQRVASTTPPRVTGEATPASSTTPEQEGRSRKRERARAWSKPGSADDHAAQIGPDGAPIGW